MLNKVILMGRLTTDPETMVIGESNVKASFVIAVPRNYKPKGSQEVDFIKINAWNKTAHFIKQYFKKGNLITLDGELHIDRYEDKDGKKASHHYVLVNQVYFCESKKEAGEEPVENEKIDDDDLPFD